MRFLSFLLSFTSRTANLLALFFFALSILGAYVNPDLFWPLALLGLGYPILLIINVFFAISWILRRRWFFLLSFIAIILSYPQLRAQWGFNYLKEENPPKGKELKLMSYNVRNFDLYNWSNRANTSQKMMDTIHQYNPDILFMQEYYTYEKFDNEKRLENLGYKHHGVSVELLHNGQLWGVSIFSKYPIIRQGEIIRQRTMSSYKLFPHRGLFADIVIGKDTIRAISVHLQSVYLGLKEYEALEEIKEKRYVNATKVWMIAQKLIKAYRYRGIQTEELKDIIHSSPYPVVLGGDFNDTPSSYAYQSITKELNDTFVEKGTGPGETFITWVPMMRIDYIMTDPKFHCVDFKRIRFKASDHNPIFAKVIIPKRP